MDFLLSNSEERVVEHSLPGHLSKYAISGAQCRYIRFRQGELISQLILGNDYSIWMHHFFIRSTTLLHPYSSENLIALHYMLSGNVAATLEGSGSFAIEEGQCHLFYIPGGIKHSATFHAGNFQSMHVNFHPTHLEMVARQYPSFEPVLSMVTHDIKLGHRQPAAMITAHIRNIIGQMLYSSLRLAERILLLESSIRDLLRLYIQDVTHAGHEYSIDMQRKLIMRVEEYIVQNLDRAMTVEIIARHFGISRSWLQQVSKNVTGRGIYHIIRTMRMESAARLLAETNHPVGVIVSMVSDMTFAAFTASFHSYYGMTPKQYRKQHGQNRQK